MPAAPLHPDFAVKPYWWEAAPPEPTSDPLPDAVDVAVVGGGYCGLSAALEVARAGASTVVLDAGRLGVGASTRNGGMVSGGLKIAPGLKARFGAELAAEMLQEGRQSLAHLEDLIARERLDADYVRCGRFVGAWSRAHYRKLEAQADLLRREADTAAHAVPRERQREEIGSDLYHGGMVVEDAGGLHPAKYHRSLRAAAASAGATLCGEAAVAGIAREPGGFVVATARGAVRAREVLVATNGYTGAATPWLRRRLIPLASYIIATEELPNGLPQRLSPKGRMLADSKRVLWYYRLSPDGKRVLFGGRASFTDSDERRAAHTLHGFLRRVWPELAEVPITHAWKGNVAFTFDLVPHIAQAEGVHYAAGCQGSGVAMATWLGHQCGRKLAGTRNRASAFERVPFPSRPLYGGRPWFLPIVGNWYRLRDRLERALG